jgi:serine protease AprX
MVVDCFWEGTGMYKRIFCILLIFVVAAMAKADYVEGFKGKIDLNVVAEAESGQNVHVIILLKQDLPKGTSQAQVASALSSALSVDHNFNLINAVSGRISPAGLDLLQDSPLVEAVYYDYEVRLTEPVASGYSALYDSIAQIGASNVTYGGLAVNGSGVKVAVIDSGIAYNHTDLGNCSTATFLAGTCARVPGGYDFINNDADPMDDYGHGTHVAGTIGADNRSGNGVRGVAPGAQLLAVKVLNSGGGGSTSSVLKGIEWAVNNGASVLSLSLGGPAVPHNGQDLMSLAANAAANSAVMVIAAGNDYSIGAVGSPGLSQGAVTVGSVNSADDPSGFSSRGVASDSRLDPDIAAPGENINSTYYTGGYAVMSGTSMATPHVSGVAALVIQAHPGWNASKVKQAILNGATNSTWWGPDVGVGRLNASEAVNNRIWVSTPYVSLDVSPNTNTTFNLAITNEDNDTILINFTKSSLVKITSCGGIPSIGSGNITFNQSNITLAPNGTGSVSINLTTPGVYSGQYVGTMQLITNVSRTINVPLVVGVFANASFQGCAAQACLDFGAPTCASYPSRGDWQFYKLNVGQRYANMSVNVSWPNIGSDFDFFIRSPKGSVYSADADSSATTYENYTISDVVPGEYIVEVHTYGLAAAPKNITGNITYSAYPTLSSNSSLVDFGYMYASSTRSYILNFSNNGANNLSISVYTSNGTEYWVGTQLNYLQLASNALFNITAANSTALTYTLNTTGVAPGTYYGIMDYASNISDTYTLPYKVIVLAGNSTDSGLTFTENVALPSCDSAQRLVYFYVPWPSVAGIRANFSWSNPANSLSLMLFDPQGNAMNLTTNSSRPIQAAANGAGSYWSAGVCYLSGAALNNYSINFANAYYPSYVATYNDSTYAWTKTVFNRGEMIYYKVWANDSNGNPVNFTANVTMYSGNGTLVKNHTAASIAGNLTSNYTIGNYDYAGNWTIVVSPYNVTIGNQTNFTVNTTYNATVNSSNTTVIPYATVQMPITVTNLGNTNNLYVFEFTQTSNWSISQENIIPSPTITPSQTQTVGRLNVVPPWALPNTTNNVTIVANSTSGNLSVNTTVTLTMGNYYNISVVPDTASFSNFSLPSNNTLNITVTNVGNTNDTISLWATPWSASFSNSTLYLNSNVSQNVTVNITAPLGATGNVTVYLMGNSSGNNSNKGNGSTNFSVPYITVGMPSNAVDATRYPSVNVSNFSTFTFSSSVGDDLAGIAKSCAVYRTSDNALMSTGTYNTTLDSCNLTLPLLVETTSYYLKVNATSARNYTGNGTTTFYYPATIPAANIFYTGPLSLYTGQSFSITGIGTYGNNISSVVNPYVWLPNSSGACVCGLTACTTSSSAGTCYIYLNISGVWGIWGNKTFLVTVIAGGSGGTPGDSGGGGGAYTPSNNTTSQTHNVTIPASGSASIKPGTKGEASITLNNTFSSEKNVTLEVNESGTFSHFNITYNSTLSIPSNSAAQANISITAYAYTRPGTYYLNVSAPGFGTKNSINVTVPPETLKPNEVNAFRYVDVAADGSYSTVALSITNKKNETFNANITEKIPKTVAAKVGDIKFTTNYSELIEDDPIITWHALLNVNQSTELSYRVNKSILNIPFAKPTVSQLGNASTQPVGPAGGEVKQQQEVVEAVADNSLIYVTVAIIAVVIVIFFFFSRYGREKPALPAYMTTK